jgi:hypothetical protein
MTTSNSIRVKPDRFRFIGSLRLCIGSSSPEAWDSAWETRLF